MESYQVFVCLFPKYEEPKLLVVSTKHTGRCHVLKAPVCVLWDAPVSEVSLLLANRMLCHGSHLTGLRGPTALSQRQARPLSPLKLPHHTDCSHPLTAASEHAGHSLLSSACGHGCFSSPRSGSWFSIF